MTLPSQSEGKDVEQIQPSCLVLVVDYPWGDGQRWSVVKRGR